MVVDPAMEALQIERLKAWRAARDDKAVKSAIAELERAAKEGRNIMEPSIVAARVGVTTGEWGTTLRRVFGEYRAPTGVAQAAVAREGLALDGVRAAVDALSAKLGRRVKFPGRETGTRRTLERRRADRRARPRRRHGGRL